MKRKILATGAAVLATAGIYAGVTATASHAAIPDANGDITLCAWDSPSYQIVHVVQPDAGYTCPIGYKIFKIKQNPTSALATVRVTAVDTAPTFVPPVTGAPPSAGVNFYNPVAHCPTGDVATGGGLQPSMTNGLTVPQSENDGPTADGKGWEAKIYWAASNPQPSMGVTVICAPGTTTP